MFHLAAQMPTSVLADMLGLATNTAVRCAALAARDWSRYTADRRDDLRQRQFKHAPPPLARAIPVPNSPPTGCAGTW